MSSNANLTMEATDTNLTMEATDTTTPVLRVNHTSIVKTTFNVSTTEALMRNMMTLHTSTVNPISLTNGLITVNITDISQMNLTSANQSTLISQGNATWSTNNTEFTTAMPPTDYLTGIMYFSFVMSATLVIMGLIANITTILVMQQPPFQSTAHSIYLSSLALYDPICIICLCLTKGSILFLFGVDFASVNTLVCQIVQFVFTMARLGSVSVIVLICVERFVAVWVPLKARLLLTKRTALVPVSCVSAIALVTSGLSVPFTGLVNGYCVYNTNTTSLAVIVQFIGLVLFSYLPLVILIILTPLTIGKLCYIKVQRLAIGSKTEDATARNATMLISVVTKNLFVSAFASVVVLTLSSSEYYRTLSQGQFMTAALECVMTVGQIAYSLNFLLYGLTSSDYKHASREMFLSVFR